MQAGGKALVTAGDECMCASSDILFRLPVLYCLYRRCRQGQYDEAMLHFGMSSLAGPLQLLRLFPSLAPPKLLAAAAAEQAVAGVAEQQQEQERQRDQQPGAGAQPAGQEPQQGQGQQQQQLEQAVAEPQGEAFVGAVQVLMPYLLSHRSRLAATAGSPPQKRAGAAADADGSSSSGDRGRVQQGTPQLAAAVGAAAEGAGPSPASRATLVQQRLEGNATAALLDTALLLSLLAMPDSGALLRCGGRGGGSGGARLVIDWDGTVFYFLVLSCWMRDSPADTPLCGPPCGPAPLPCLAAGLCSGQTVST
jgi:hypothetical protein